MCDVFSGSRYVDRNRWTTAPIPPEGEDAAVSSWSAKSVFFFTPK